MRRRFSLILVLLTILALFVSPALAYDDADGPAEDRHAHEHPDDGGEGHLPAVQRNVALLGQVNIRFPGAGNVADVAAYGNYAYLTVRDPEACYVAGEESAGVAIVDISDPRNPVQVGFVNATPGSQPGEGADILDVKTKAFTGQILLFNNELCDATGEGGFSLWDVTDPRNPQVLTANFGDPDALGEPTGYFNEIHSAFAWQDDHGRAFIVVSDNYEPGTADIDIFEITDPRNPVLLSETGLNELGVLQEENTPLGAASFLHDMTVQKVRGDYLLLVSYWDGGWAVLNVNDPANPVLVNNFDYPYPDTLLANVGVSEGNAHQAEFSPNGKYIIGTDEDFSPYRLTGFDITSGPAAGRYGGGEFGWTVPIAQQFPGGLTGTTVYGGSGCVEDVDGNGVSDRAEVPPASATGADIIVFSRGTCFFSIKVESGQLAGYDAVIIGNSHAGSGNGTVPDAFSCGGRGHDFEITASALCIGHRAMHLLFNDPVNYTGANTDIPVGTMGAMISAKVVFDGWGYVRLLDTRTMQQIDAYAIAEALDPAFAFGFGDLSVHEVAVDPWKKDLAYLSYYSGGLRVIQYGQDGITEVGAYISPEGNNFWGIEAHRLPQGTPGFGKETLILASDRDSGLWIFRYTDKGKP